MADKKEKKYVSDNAQLLAEWNWERNTDVDPTKTSTGTDKKVWWKCKQGHEWQATVSNKAKGRGCPYCYGRYPTKGLNDLQTVNPELSKEWNYEKNIGLTPMDVLPNSNKNVWWKCENGHEWQARIAGRSNGNGCPYCSGRYAISGLNDLKTINPTLAEEWNYARNKGMNPEKFTAHSGEKAWWKCAHGHEWQALISDRANGNGMPILFKQKSFKRI